MLAGSGPCRDRLSLRRSAYEHRRDCFFPATSGPSHRARKSGFRMLPNGKFPATSLNTSSAQPGQEPTLASDSFVASHLIDLLRSEAGICLLMSLVRPAEQIVMWGRRTAALSAP